MSKKQNMILVPIDFTEQSLIALREAENLAKTSQAELTLLSIIEESGFFARVFGDKSEEEVEKLIKGTKLKLQEIAARSMTRTGNDVNVLVSRGKVYQKIVEFSESIDADYIVMGTQGQPKTMKRIMGSNANRVIRTSKIPVITIKGQEHKHCDTIVLPLDLEKETKEKVSNAIEFARIFNAKVKVVSIIKTSMDEDETKTLKNNLHQVYKFMASKGVDVDGDLLFKDKSAKINEEILQYASDCNADLIMIMTQQEDEFTPHFLGSAAQNIIYNSKVPVMSIRPKVTNFAYDLP
ncbi:MAG: universal stress protein [Flavobacteriales bacterium]